MSDRPQSKCPRCGAELAAGRGPGVCPRCAAGVLQATETQVPAAPLFTPPPISELAFLFPQLEILELVGQGGMGAVYKARQKELDRIVVLKILPPGVGRESAFAERFTREARALAKLNHPGIVTLYEFGRADGLFFFLMEFVDGVNLRRLLQAGRVSAREALAIVPQICDALQYAHDQGIVHRDIKPENILLDRRGRVKVADFGLAKLMGVEPDAAGEGKPEQVGVAQGPVLTEAGKVVGTPQYMSPEQIQAPGEVDHRADIYALGVVFYQMLTGELPGKDLAPPSSKVRIDVRLDEIVLRALEKDPERRYQQASVLKTRVETLTEPCLPQKEIPATPRLSRIAVAGICCLAFTLLALIVFLSFLYRSYEITPAAIRKLAPLFWTAPFVVTGLGWWSLIRIRRSSGGLRGLPLALFGGMFFPLILMDWLLFAAATYFGWTGSANTLSLPVAGVLGALALGNCLLVHWIWRLLVLSEAPGSGSRKTRPRWIVATTGIVPLFLAVSFFAFLLLAQRSPLTSARQLAAACIISAQLNSNQLPARLEDLKSYVGPEFKFSKFVLVSTGRLDTLPKPAHQTVLFRTVGPDSKGLHVLAFADGHVEFRRLDAPGPGAPAARDYLIEYGKPQSSQSVKPVPPKVIGRLMEDFKRVDQMRASAGTNIFKPEVMKAYKGELAKIWSEFEQGLQGTEAEPSFLVWKAAMRQEIEQSRTNGGVLDPKLGEQKRRASETLEALINAASQNSIAGAPEPTAPVPSIPLDTIAPTLTQLGSGWNSNRVVVQIEPLRSPSPVTNANERPGWLKEAQRMVAEPGHEAHSVFRYYFASNSVLVTLNRYKAVEAMPANWGDGSQGKTNLPNFPKLGDETRFYQRDGLHNNIAFRRGTYLVDVEGMGAPMDKLLQLATMVDQDLAKSLAAHRMWQAIDLYEAGKLEAAEKLLREALKEDPDNKAVNRHLDRVMELQRKEKAGAKAPGQGSQ